MSIIFAACAYIAAGNRSLVNTKKNARVRGQDFAM
jgi:hypothetical protein